MHKLYLVLFSVISMFFFSNCTDISLQISEPSEEEVEIIKPIGDQIAKNLVKELQAELKAAIKDGGFEKAVNVCNLRAAPITEIAANATDRKIEIKRTTNKFRNPLNAPDKFEKEALKYFDGLISSGKPLPKFYIQKIEAGNSTIFNYYKPMKTGSNCLTCHGDPSMIKPDILKSISGLYPADKAIGYKENDFRGLIRITIGN
ncbi:MAG: DUF3365 domain-containing protein [Bacteroidetes bacterium]|nr:MAG: DUF3365 domain-containing protein [Bacteroidota bacterium]